MPSEKKYTYSKRAEKDLIKIYQDTARKWGIAQADKYDTGLEKTVYLLSENPGLGRQCDEVKAGFRRFEYGRHIIFYRQRKTDIFIGRIIHDQMDVKRHV